MTDAIALPLRGAPLTLPAQNPIAAPQNNLQGAPLPLVPHPATPNAQSERNRHTAQEFETVFLNEMLTPMFEGLSTDGLGGGGVGEEMFRPMLIDQYAHALSHMGGVGIADQIMRELNRMQTVTPPAPDTDHGSGR
jgi:Rod binding domain-containing protein